ncbi:helix-turn-helix domain-containing protein, partial [bacterium]
MTAKRLYRIGLGPGLRTKTFGSFLSEDSTLRWSQPAGMWMALLLWHPAALVVNGERIDLDDWSFAIVPAGARCELHWKSGEPGVYDYFGFVPDNGPESGMAVPQATSLGSAGPFWDVEFRKGLSRLGVTNEHVGHIARALLWSVAQPADALRRNVYVAEAERLIAAESGPRLKVSDLAQAVGISQAQLSRLFVAEHGTPPLQFIRTAQAQRAHRLLTSTVEPIKAIAAECGFPDLQAFNRFVRDRLGASPREIRAGQGA